MPKIEDPVVESFSEESGEELEALPSVIGCEIKEKEKVSQNEVFGMASKRNKDLDVKKVKKPKREISEAQRERLRLGREKGLAKRKANAEAKRLEKLKLKDTSVAKPVAEEEVKEVIKEKIIDALPGPQGGITKEEVISLTSEASKKALEDYEILRKSRKQEKKKRLEEENHRPQVRHKIETAVKGPSRDTTFDFCFS